MHALGQQKAEGILMKTTGVIKWYNPRKGYGFITTEDGKDVFVHYSSIKSDGYQPVNEGDAVLFDVVSGTHGDRAENVTKRDDSPRAFTEPD